MHYREVRIKVLQAGQKYVHRKVKKVDSEGASVALLNAMGG